MGESKKCWDSFEYDMVTRTGDRYLADDIRHAAQAVHFVDAHRHSGSGAGSGCEIGTWIIPVTNIDRVKVNSDD